MTNFCSFRLCGYIFICYLLFTICYLLSPYHCLFRVLFAFFHVLSVKTCVILVFLISLPIPIHSGLNFQFLYRSRFTRDLIESCFSVFNPCMEFIPIYSGCFGYVIHVIRDFPRMEFIPACRDVVSVLIRNLCILNFFCRRKHWQG